MGIREKYRLWESIKISFIITNILVTFCFLFVLIKL